MKYILIKIMEYFQVYKKIDDGALKEYKALTGNGANEQSILKAKMM